MKLSWFVSINLIILVGLLHVYHWAKINFDEKDVLAHQIKTLSKELHHSELKLALVENQFLGFKQEIASVLPSHMKGQEGLGSYQLRSVASVTQALNSSKNEAAKATLAEIQFESARRKFTEQKYEESTKLLKSFIERHGYSSKAPEAHFLLIESLYQEGRVEDSVVQIHHLIDLFPGHEVSGFAMIRLAKILEAGGRATDAIDLYKTVLKTFPHREVAHQAKESLAGVGY